MFNKIKKNYFILIITFFYIYFFFNLLDGERGLISYIQKKVRLEKKFVVITISAAFLVHVIL